MENILIIGNGFDLYHGLPTRYTDFLRFVELWDHFKVKYNSNHYPQLKGKSKKHKKEIKSRTKYHLTK